MAKLINGRVRFEARPQPFIEMSDKFYFLGQGYTKYSLSPIKNDFSVMTCDGDVFPNYNFLPIAKNVVNFKYFMDNSDIRKSNVEYSENAIIIDSADSNIEYMITNPVYGSIRVVKFYRNLNKYEKTVSVSASSRRASFIGQSKDYVYLLVNGSYTSIFYALNKDTMAMTTLCSYYSLTSGYYTYEYSNLYEDEEVIVSSIITNGSGGSGGNFTPRLVVINKTTNTSSIVNPVLENSDFGLMNINSGTKYQVSRPSNGIKSGDTILSYCLATRAKDGVTESTLVRLEYNLKTLKSSYKEFTRKDGFDIDELNSRALENLSHCYLEFDSTGDKDILNIIDGYTMVDLGERTGLASSVTTFDIDTFSSKLKKINNEKLTENDYMYHVMRMSEDTLAVITSSSIVYCTKDKKDKIYRKMNIEPIDPAYFIMKDSDQNIWSLSLDSSVHRYGGPKARVNMFCRFEKDKYEYKNRNINTNVIVGMKDYVTGKLVRGNVILKVSNNCVFTGNDSNVIEITTSEVSEIKVPVTIKASGNLTTQIDLNFDTEE